MKMKGRKHAKATKWDSNAEHNRQAAAQRLLQNVIFSFLISLILFLKKLENDHFYCFLALDFIRSLSLSFSLSPSLSKDDGTLGFSEKHLESSKESERNEKVPSRKKSLCLKEKKNLGEILMKNYE